MESSGYGDGSLSVDASGDRQAPLVGRLLDGRYRLDSQIARGGMATVFVATDTRLDRQVAVKVMHRALAEDPEFVARFTREAKASARLSAAEVVAVHDYGTDPSTGLAYLVMEHIRGINLRQLLLERGALTPARAVALMEPVLRALAAAHAAGLVHRDIKPENVLLADDGRVKVADFGLARAVEASNLTQTTGLLMGTVAYLSPEQVETGLADARSDVYAAGVVLWELLTGTPPYSAETPLAVAYKHVHEDIPPPSSAMSGIPPALDALVTRATRRVPGDRPANGEAFLNELRTAAGGLPSVAEPSVTQHQTVAIPRPPAGTPERPPRTKRRRPWLVPTAAFLALALAVLAGGWYLGTQRFTKAPGVTGKTFAEASSILDSEGLDAKRGVAEFSEFVAVNLVLKQTPGLGAKIRKGGTVTLVMSLGPDRRVVPSLVGKAEAAAKAALVRVGLKVAEKADREYHPSVQAGSVIRTDPPAGRKLKPGTAVTLVLSRGTPPVPVPNVVGQPKAEAELALVKKGFKVNFDDAFSDTVEKGRVISQSPAASLTAPRGSTVRLTISKGPDIVTVPNVRFKSEDDAVRILREAGLVPEIRDSGGPFNRVYGTDPSAGAKVRRGTVVRVIVY
jgi:beta-lactam-binding protein with PASTA domain/tRNA A-37 threonylcarbamoyl transferase component Bud32